MDPFHMHLSYSVRPAPYFFFALGHWAAGSGFEPGSAEQQADALLSELLRIFLSYAACYLRYAASF